MAQRQASEMENKQDADNSLYQREDFRVKSS